jgi:hypothetical protein
MRSTVTHCLKVALFVLLSLGDLFLTWSLLRHGTGSVYESNPIANLWLESYGWWGLAAFKLSLTLLVASVAFIAYRHRPVLARRFANFACLTLTLVVGYSGFLLWQVKTDPEMSALVSDEQILAERNRLEMELSRVAARRASQEQVVKTDHSNEQSAAPVLLATHSIHGPADSDRRLK